MALFPIVWPLLLFQAVATLKTIQANDELLVVPLPSLSPIDNMADLIQIDETQELPQAAKSHEETKKRHGKKPKTAVKQKGGYKTKEEIHKPPTFDHPCNLTRLIKTSRS